MPDLDQETDEQAGGGRNKDSLGQILLVALGVCLVCSILVSATAVALKPAQLANKALDQKQNILRAAGLLEEGASTGANGETVDELFSAFKLVAVDLKTGEGSTGFRCR